MSLAKLKKEVSALCPAKKGGTRYEDVHRVLGYAGFELKPRRGKGSHKLYRHPGLKHPHSAHGIIQFGIKDGLVNRTYVKQICEALKYLLNLEEKKA